MILQQQIDIFFFYLASISRFNVSKWRWKVPLLERKPCIPTSLHVGSYRLQRRQFILIRWHSYVLQIMPAVKIHRSQLPRPLKSFKASMSLEQLIYEQKTRIQAFSIIADSSMRIHHVTWFVELFTLHSKRIGGYHLYAFYWCRIHGPSPEVICFVIIYLLWMWPKTCHFSALCRAHKYAL